MIEKINKKMYHYVLTEKELMVHFQPIVSISKRKIYGRKDCFVFRKHQSDRVCICHG